MKGRPRTFTSSAAMLAAACFSIVVSGGLAQTCVPPPSGLVGWWRAEGDTLDQAANYNGTLAGNATFVSGKVGQAFLLDGNIGSAVRLTNSEPFKLQDFTIEAWIRRSSASKVSANPAQDGLVFALGSGSYGFGLSADGNGKPFLTQIDSSSVSATNAVSDTNFHHLAMTKSGTTVIFYLDGTAYPAGPYDVTFVFGASAAIGARSDSLGNSFLGAIDELAFYNRVLDSSEIAAIFNAGSAGKCATNRPSITTPPVDQTVSEWGSAFFSVVASGAFPLHYQWTLNGTNLGGATAASLALVNVRLGQAGNYAVQVTNSYGSATSSIALLTVNPALACAAPPAGLVSWWRAELNTLDQVGGNNGTLVDNATYGPGNVGQGFVLDGNGDAVSVGNQASLQLQNFTIEAWIARADASQVSGVAGQDGLIFAYGSGGYGLGLDANGLPLLARVNFVNVKGAIAITDTGFHHLAVSKSGTNVVFYIDGVADPAPAFANTFTFTSGAAVGAKGDFFNGFLGTIDEVSVYNRPLAAGEISAIFNASAGGKCPGPTAPSITSQPQDQTVGVGTNATFAVLAAGSGPISYQWLFRGTNVLGATNYTLVITNVQLSSTGGVQVVVTNPFGSVTSVVATLAVAGPPVINSQPQDVAVAPSSTATFVVGASGSLPLFFQWRRNGTNVVGANNYSLVLTNVQAAVTGSYAVVITNTFGSVTSAPAALTLQLPPAISNQPASQTVPAGSNPAFTVGASGSSPLKYQWKFSGTNLTGATNSSFVVFDVQASNGGPYSVVVSNNYGSVTSSTAGLAVTNPLCASGPTGLVAWWQAEGNTVEAVTGASGTLRTNTTFATGKVGQAFSFNGSGAAVSLSNSAAWQLQDLTIEAWVKRASAALVSPISNQDGLFFSYGSGGYGFGLRASGQPLLTGVGVSAASAGPAVTDTNFHHLAMTKSGTSVVFYIDGTAFPTSLGGAFTFTTAPAIGARGDNFGNNFLGAVDELSIYNRSLSAAEVQSVYFATSKGKCAYPLSWVTQPTNQTATVGSTVTFTAAAAGSRPVGYQWRLNGAGVNNATNPNLTLSGITFFQAGNYTLTASNPVNSITSSVARLTVLSVPLPTNGSFETGSAAGWVLSDISSPVSPLAVHGAGFNSGFGFFSSAPTDGSFCLTHGFDGNGPGRIRAALDVYLPPSPTTLIFNYRAGWDMQNYAGSTKPRIFAVVIEPYGGGVGLQTNTILTAAPGTANYDTGNLTASVDLSAFSNRGIRISFDAIIPESFTGPGFFQLDNVVLSYRPTPPLLMAKSNGNVVLTWPATFSNFSALVASNLLPPVAWASIPTNLISHGATSATLTLPITRTNQFYRLKSF